MARTEQPICGSMEDHGEENDRRKFRAYVRKPGGKGYVPIGWFCPGCQKLSTGIFDAAEFDEMRTLNVVKRPKVS